MKSAKSASFAVIACLLVMFLTVWDAAWGDDDPGHNITITKCMDRRGDGTCSGYLEGWEFTAYYPVNDTAAPDPESWDNMTAATDANGTVVFQVPAIEPDAKYMICETVQDGWVLTGVDYPVNATDPAWQNYANCSTFYYNYDYSRTFTNAELPKVQLVKYNDTAGDGSAGDQNPIAEWAFSLERYENGSWVAAGNCTTDAAGSCWIDKLPADSGNYRVRESVDGWVLTEARYLDEDGYDWSLNCPGYLEPDENTATIASFYLDGPASAATIEVWNWPPQCNTTEVPDYVCAGDIVPVGVNANSGSDPDNYTCTVPQSYSWASDPDGGAFSAPNETSGNWTAPGSAGNYTLTATVAYGGGWCAASGQTEVIVPSLSVPNVTVCGDQLPGNMTAVVEGCTPESFAWTFGGNPLGCTAGTCSFEQPGTYTSAVTCAEGGCEAEGSGVLSVNPLPTCVISAPSVLAFNEVGEAYTDDAGPGATYEWTAVGGTILSPQPYTHSIQFKPNPGAVEIKLNVRVANQFGCICEYDPPIYTPGGSPDPQQGLEILVQQPVPAISPWGMALMLVLLAALGIKALNRRPLS